MTNHDYIISLVSRKSLFFSNSLNTIICWKCRCSRVLSPVFFIVTLGLSYLWIIISIKKKTNKAEMIFSNFRTPRITEVVRVFKIITWKIWRLVLFGFLIFFHQNEQGWKRARKKTWRRNSLIKNFKHIPKCQFRAVCKTGKLDTWHYTFARAGN